MNLYVLDQAERKISKLCVLLWGNLEILWHPESGPGFPPRRVFLQEPQVPQLFEPTDT